MAVPEISTGALLVFGLIVVALVLFVSEAIPTDTTAVGIIVVLVVLEPWTGVSGPEAISGFASPATVTIVAMYMLSAGIQRTGIVGVLGRHIARVTGGDERRLLAATIGTTGPIAGIINNTPVVAVFIPMIQDLADESGISPSKLLLPLSYAAMLGGTLTLIGTSTNILASDLAAQLLPAHGPIAMFEFTKLGVVVLAVGALYLMTIGRRLTPARIEADVDLTEIYELEDYLALLRVREGSPLLERDVDGIHDEVESELGIDVNVIQVTRGEETIPVPTDRTVEPDDVLTVRGSLQAVNQFAETYDLRQLSREKVSEDVLHTPEYDGGPVEAVVTPESGFAGKSVADVKFQDRYDTTVLAVRRGGTTYQTDLGSVTLEAGDTLLLQSTEDAIDYFAETGDLLVTHAPSEDLRDAATPEAEPALDSKAPIALGIMVGVIATAALDLVPIVIAALGGVFAMVVTGSLRPNEAYDAVSWNVIFLLAGVIPLGMAMQNTAGDAVIAAMLEGSATFLPVIAVLGLFYLVTGLLANVITPVASVVLMIPIAVDTAARIGGNGFAFLLAVTFAASTAFMTPVGYQTNLMVYGPGGYRFADFVRVGAPLQLLLTVVTTLGIAFFWGAT